MAARHRRCVTAGLPSSCEVLQWSWREAAPLRLQSIAHPGLSSVHPFTAPSGISERWLTSLSGPLFTQSRGPESRFCFLFAAYLMLAGLTGSSLYSWRPDAKLFTVILRVPAARSFLSLPVPSLNTTKMLLASSGEDGASVYHLGAVSNQSDFIPRSANPPSPPYFFQVMEESSRYGTLISGLHHSFMCILHIQFWGVALCTW